MAQELWLVICPENGWNNVVAIFDRSRISLDEVQKGYPQDIYTILDSWMNTRGDLEEQIEERRLFGE